MRPPSSCEIQIQMKAANTFDGLRNATVVLDFGQLMNARLGFRLKAPAGAKIDIGYSYRLEDGRVIPYVSLRTPMADQYTTREGEQEWQTFQWRHCRYVQLTFRDLHGEIELFNVWAEEVRNPFAERGEFVCSDPLLNQAFVMSRRTADLCVVDHTMDNPSRERRQHGGRLQRHPPGFLGLLWRCGRGPQILCCSIWKASTAPEYIGGPIPASKRPKSRSWGTRSVLCCVCTNTTCSTPMRNLVARLWLGIERLVEMCCSFLDEEGLMPLPPYGIFFDWADLQREGLSLYSQCLVLRGVAACGGLGRGRGTNRAGSALARCSVSSRRGAARALVGRGAGRILRLSDRRQGERAHQ